MATRSSNRAEALNSDEIGDLLDDLKTRIDRCKVLFEQYFLGIQKTAPSQLHTELERKIRQVTQVHIRNTGQRYRFTTLSQKFASYNTYWKRTMRQIENGTYIRDIARLQRKSERAGKDVPDELLSKMPKRMRDRILRDREVAAKRVERAESREQVLQESGKVRDHKPGNVHQLDEGDLLDDLDLDSIFSSMTGGTDAPQTPAPAPTPAPTRRQKSSDDTDVDDLFASVMSKDGGLVEDTVEAALPTPPPRRQAPAARRPAPARPTPAPAAGPSTSAAKPPPGMSVTESQALYKRYKKARELVGENTSNLSYDKLMRSLNKQAPKILKEHKAQGVSFNVVVKGDRVVLKAKPKK